MPAGTIAIDIDPKAPGIIKQDFLTYSLPTGRRIAVVGNPPFGRNTKMARAMFRHAAKKADLIAFILPATFRKAWMLNQIDPNFRLVSDTTLPRNAFTFEGKDFDMPAVFQIWVRCPTPRLKIPIERHHADFEFTTADKADFVIWRVGAKAGEIHYNFEMSKNSHHFVRITSRTVDVVAVMALLPFAEVASNTAGNPSLAEPEIVALYKAFMANPHSQIPLIPPPHVITAQPHSGVVDLGRPKPNRGTMRRRVKFRLSRRLGQPRLRSWRLRRRQRYR